MMFYYKHGNSRARIYSKTAGTKFVFCFLKKMVSLSLFNGKSFCSTMCFWCLLSLLTLSLPNNVGCSLEELLSSILEILAFLALTPANNRHFHSVLPGSNSEENIYLKILHSCRSNSTRLSHRLMASSRITCFWNRYPLRLYLALADVDMGIYDKT